MKYIFYIALFLFPCIAMSQDSMIEEKNKEPIVANKDVRFNRPTTFKHNSDKGSFSIGGIAEANTEFIVSDGIGQGAKFEFRDFHLVAQARFLKDKLHFFVDAGYDPATRGISLTEAALNMEFHPTINLRGGIILPPLGYFNQYGDSPRNSFVDKPLSSTTIIPGSYSEVGLGIHGNIKLVDNLELTYEMYAVNGLQDEITDNDLGRTAIDMGKNNATLGGDDNNKELAFNGRVGLLASKFGEIGFSYYRGTYNVTHVEEVEVDKSRSLAISTIDAQAKLFDLSLRGEFSLAKINIFEGLGQVYGSKQLGYHIEASYPILKNIVLANIPGKLELASRIEYVDYNVGKFEQTNSKIFDEILGVRAGVNFRLGDMSVIKANYSYFWQKDILGNPVKTGTIQFGFATYY